MCEVASVGAQSCRVGVELLQGRARKQRLGSRAHMCSSVWFSINFAHSIVRHGKRKKSS